MAAGDAPEPLRRSPSPATQWRAALATAPRAAHWNDLATSRATLLHPAADPHTRRIGEGLAALQNHLMSFEGSREDFAAAAHTIDSEIQAHADMPSQAVLIAYADLQVQWQTADRRWPRAAPEPGPRGSAEEA